MKLTVEQVQHVAKLARLELEPQAVETLAGQLATILDYVDKLSEVDTSRIEPTSHAIALTNAFREDRIHTHLEPQEALANAPAKEEGSFVVPKVI
ncbi:MAG: Asp-tRNA(Asn)/Glu-tRNA(Gln) amidotransferase subunit GatC [Desulfobacteraceae bacterium]|jgi:aspartyl-tRNA(Asn)/glutamyl-tRNA(Gln) amidotransferase subunit C